MLRWRRRLNVAEWNAGLVDGFEMTTHFRRPIEFLTANVASRFDAVMNRTHVDAHVTDLSETLVANWTIMLDSTMNGIQVNL